MNVKEKSITTEELPLRSLREIRSYYKGAEKRNIDVSVYDDTIVKDTVSGSIAVGSSPYLLNNIQQGVGTNQSSGRRYWLRSVQIRGQVRYDPSSASSLTATVRLMLIVDRRANGANSGYVKLLEPPSDVENSVFAFRDLDSSTRFDVLHDRIITLQPTSNVASTEQADAVQMFQFYSNLDDRGYEVTRSDISGSYPDNYQIFLIAVGTPSAASLKCDFVSRVRFSSN